MSTRSLLGLAPAASLLLLATSAPVEAQTAQLSVKEGDVVLGAGTVKFVNKIAITDRGLHFVEVTTNAPNATDTSILRNGFLSIQESTPLLNPGGSILRWDDLDVNLAGNCAWPLTLQDTGTNANNAGVFYNTQLLILKGGPTLAPEVPANTTYRAFSAVRINDNNLVFAIVDIDDPSITVGPGQQEDALVLMQVGPQGQLLSESMPIHENQIVAGAPINSTGMSPNSIAINNAGDWLAGVILGLPASSTNDTIILLNGNLVAQESGPAPVPPVPVPRTYADLRDPELDLNDFGEYVFNAGLDTSDPATNNMIVKNGQKFVQEGDIFPSISPFAVLQFDSAPVYIGNSGDVYWFSRTNNGALSQDTLYYRNFDVIVQEGLTLIAGDVVSSLRGTPYAFHVSPSGRFWVGEVSMQSIGDVMLLVDFGAVVPVPGCSNNPSRLEKLTGDARPNASLTFQMSLPQGAGVTPLLFFSTAPAVEEGALACGLNTSFGELLIGLGGGQLIGRLRGATSTGSTTPFLVKIPNDPNLVDQKLWMQGAFWDAANVAPGPVFSLTNGMYLEIGAP